eukprot:PhM_4_TR10381/c0_g1_i1/m.31137/K08267/RICTOR; rapamycin-insensitive companion of mTOR
MPSLTPTTPTTTTTFTEDDLARAVEVLRGVGADTSSYLNAKAHIEILSTAQPSIANSEEISKSLQLLQLGTVGAIVKKISVVLESFVKVGDVLKNTSNTTEEEILAVVEMGNEMTMLGRQLFSTTTTTSLETSGGGLVSYVSLCNGIASMIRRLIVCGASYLRAVGLRVARAFVSESVVLSELWQMKGHWFIAQCMDRDPKVSLKEREQALKFIVQLAKTKMSSNNFIPTPIIMRLVIMAEGNENNCRRRCIEALRLLLVRSPKSVALSGGIRPLMHAALDDKLADITPSILNAFVFCLETTEGRAFLRLNSDFSVLAAPFTENIPSDPKLQKELFIRMKMAKTAIVGIARTWPGLFWFGSDPQGLRPLIHILYLPGNTQRKMIILELFNCLLRAAAPHRAIASKGAWTLYELEEPTAVATGDGVGGAGGAVEVKLPDNVAASDLSNNSGTSSNGAMSSSITQYDIYGAELDDALLSNNDDEATNNIVSRMHVMDAFLGTLLKVFEREGLTRALIALVREGVTTQANEHVSQGAAQLLQQLLATMESLFPRVQVLELHNEFDIVIAHILSERADGDMAWGSDCVKTLMTRLQSDFDSTAQDNHRHKTASLRLSNIKLQLATSMDDAAFQSLVRETQVLSAKEWTRWNLDAILLLIRGPLRLQPRLKEIGDKFCPRLLGFMKPSKNLFHVMLRDRHAAFATMAYRLTELLLMTRDGTHILSESGLLAEIKDKLSDVLLARLPEKERVFNKEHMSYHMTREYFRLIGRCGNHPNGIALLEQHKLFETLHALVSLSTDSVDPADVRNDIAHQIVTHMNFGSVPNYGINAKARPILLQALTGGSKALRYFATKELRKTLSTSYADNIDWVLTMLTQQLGDSFAGVSDCALGIICDICIGDDHALDAFIATTPPPEQLLKDGELSQFLLMAVLRRPAGFAYLHHLGWTVKQCERWLSTADTTYAEAVERIVADASSSDAARTALGTTGPATGPRHQRTMSSEIGARSRSQLARYTVPGAIPLHFFGELCRTEGGATWLSTTEVWGTLTTMIKDGVQHLADIELAVDADADKDEVDVLVDTVSTNRGELKDLVLSGTSFAAASPIGSPRGRPTGADLPDDFDATVTAMSNTDSSALVNTTFTITNHQQLASLSPTAPVPASIKQNPATFNVSQRDYVQSHAITPSSGTTRCKNSTSFRGALWAVAHIGSTDEGFSLFFTNDKSNMLRTLITVAQTCESISLRGLVLTLLGLLGQSPLARAALATHGWVATSPQEYVGVGQHQHVTYSAVFAHPKVLDDWVSIPRPRFRGIMPSVTHSTRAVVTRLLSELSDAQREVLRLVANLTSPVLHDSAMKELTRMLKANAALSNDVTLYLHVLRTLSYARCRIAYRRSLLDLFSAAMKRGDVLDELDRQYNQGSPRTNTSISGIPTNTSLSGTTSAMVDDDTTPQQEALWN